MHNSCIFVNHEIITYTTQQVLQRWREEQRRGRKDSGEGDEQESRE